MNVRSLVRFLAMALVALAAASSGGGCAYMKARGRDFSQVFRFEIGPSLAFGFDTRLGGLMDLGLGGGFAWTASDLYGEGYLGKQELIVAPGVCLRGLGPTEIWSHECPSILPPVFAQEQYTQGKYTHLGTLQHEFDIEVAVMAAILYFRFGLSPGELGDAFAGIFGFDPAGDDGGAKPEPAPDIPPLSEREKRRPPPAGPARPVGETPPPGTEYHKVPPADQRPAPPPPPPPPPKQKAQPSSGSSTSTSSGSSSGPVVEPKAPPR